MSSFLDEIILLLILMLFIGFTKQFSVLLVLYREALVI